MPACRQVLRSNIGAVIHPLNLCCICPYCQHADNDLDPQSSHLVVWLLRLRKPVRCTQG